MNFELRKKVKQTWNQLSYPLTNFHLTADNHFESYDLPRSETQGKRVFIARMGECQRVPKSAIAESVLAAQKIAKQAESHNKKVQLCLSGGVDSESMLISFIEAGVDFEPVILRFSKNLNEYDIATALDVCREHSLKPTVLELDVIDFFTQGKHLYYGREYQCQSPQLAVHMYLLDQLDGVPVLSGNPLMPTFSNKKLYNVGLPGDLHSCFFRYFKKTRRPGVPFFFIYTPEQAYAFLRTTAMQSYMFLSRKSYKMNYNYFLKCQTYQQGGFKVQPRHDKYTGFEKVRFYYDKKMGTTWGTGFDKLFRKPLQKMNPYPEEFIQYFSAKYLYDFEKWVVFEESFRKMRPGSIAKYFQVTV